MVLALLSLFVSWSAPAKEPGYFGAGRLSLSTEFERARGLLKYEIETLHFNRIDCGRRAYTQDGASLEGDANIKATSVPPFMIEIEFPTFMNLNGFGAKNPFGNDVEILESVTRRQLIDLRKWSDGQTLGLSQQVSMSYDVDKKQAEIKDARIEVKVLDGTYPSTYLVRETVMANPKFEIYFVCQ